MSTRTVTISMVTCAKYRAQQAESAGNPASTPNNPDGSGSPNPTEGLGRTPSPMEESAITGDHDGSTQHEVVVSTPKGQQNAQVYGTLGVNTSQFAPRVAEGPVPPNVLRHSLEEFPCCIKDEWREQACRPGVHTVYGQNPSCENAECIFAIRWALTELKNDKDSEEATPQQQEAWTQVPECVGDEWLPKLKGIGRYWKLSDTLKKNTNGGSTTALLDE
ncbi:hypothetical protein HYDPIDRAFT_171193 [Hydnomerulius pinastri MD-312]|uniref:Uncharacterized protein n=1 Tax=Hydnomerulius pinastri MD-312 TaxID=994086 RepID=A0A0C9W814_9AGAM|nr:hypothetical protein HYDPIDRAFT_171193 [Hydnomerulius pinastri MD-312]